MKTHLTAAALAFLISVPLFAQTSASAVKPPDCGAGFRKASRHPSSAELLQTQEQAVADPSVIVTPEPVGNMGVLRFAVRDYADCTGDKGCYWADLDAQTRRALTLLEEGVHSASRNAKLAMVLDIDETSMSSYCEEVAEDFGYIPDRYESWIVKPEASIPIPGTVRLADRAEQLGVSVFFITGRPEAQRAATEANLRSAGYKLWKGLALKQPKDKDVPTATYKSAERAKIQAAGYTLLLNMGDQWSDLQGQPMAEHSVKLPNPFYYLP